MKYILLLMALMLPKIALSEERPLLNEVNQLVWKNRIILIWSDQNDTDYERSLKRYEYEINDRDIIWFILNDTGVITNYEGELSSEFIGRTKQNYPIERGSVLLIGKDGGIKDRDNTLQLKPLFEKIDSMPMRQYEVRSKTKSQS